MEGKRKDDQSSGQKEKEKPKDSPKKAVWSDTPGWGGSVPKEPKKK